MDDKMKLIHSAIFKKVVWKLFETGMEKNGGSLWPG